MTDGGGPYLFDVGVIALAHAGTPVSDGALAYVKDAIAGEVDAVVPYPALFGAHVVLTNYYGFSNEEASALMTNLADAGRIHWYDSVPKSVVRDAFDVAATLNIDAWDGYYAQVALEEGVQTIVTLDEDFTAVEGVETDVVLSTEEFSTLNDHIER